MKRERLIETKIGHLTVVTTASRAEEVKRYMDDPRRRRALNRIAGLTVPYLKESPDDKQSRH